MVKLKVITVCIPFAYVDFIDAVVNEGYSPNRSEAIRVAIRDFLPKAREEMRYLAPFSRRGGN